MRATVIQIILFTGVVIFVIAAAACCCLASTIITVKRRTACVDVRITFGAIRSTVIHIILFAPVAIHMIPTGAFRRLASAGIAVKRRAVRSNTRIAFHIMRSAVVQIVLFAAVAPYMFIVTTRYTAVLTANQRSIAFNRVLPAAIHTAKQHPVFTVLCTIHAYAAFLDIVVARNIIAWLQWPPYAVRTCFYHAETIGMNAVGFVVNTGIARASAKFNMIPLFTDRNHAIAIDAGKFC